MRLIARSNIIGINSDEGLKALDGYMEYSADVDDENLLIDMFERDNPNFRANNYEIVR
jgi:hypothetical protein